MSNAKLHLIASKGLGLPGMLTGEEYEDSLMSST
jgi:hypothetical protein